MTAVAEKKNDFRAYPEGNLPRLARLDPSYPLYIVGITLTTNAPTRRKHLNDQNLSKNFFDKLIKLNNLVNLYQIT